MKSNWKQIITYLIFFGILLFFIVNASNEKGYTNCYVERELETEQKDVISKYINPMNITTLLCILMTLTKSFKETEKAFTFEIEVINQIIQSILLHRVLYIVSIIIQSYLNDRTCSPKHHLNGISDHCYTIIYFFHVFFRFIESNNKTPLPYPISEEINKLSNSHDINTETEEETEERETNEIKENNRKKIIEYILFILYILFSLITLHQTIYHGYHSPKQMIYGMIFSIVSICIYELFIKYIRNELRAIVGFCFGVICYLIGKQLTPYVRKSSLRSVFVFGIISLLILGWRIFKTKILFNQLKQKLTNRALNREN